LNIVYFYDDVKIDLAGRWEGVISIFWVLHIVTGKILTSFDSKFHFGIYCLFYDDVKIELAGPWGGVISFFGFYK
jgi:hypothetical protein